MQEKSTLKTFPGKQFKVLIILILCFNHVFSQNENYPYETQIPCGGVEELSDSTAKTYYCSPIGTDYTSDYQLIEHYKNYANQPLKTLQIALHIFRDNWGNFVDERDPTTHDDDIIVWQENATTTAYVQQLEGWINEFYATVDPSSETYANPIFTVILKLG